MFDDLINKDEKENYETLESLIESLKDNITKKEQFIKDLIDESYEQEDKIRKLKHELDYLRNL